VCAVVDGENHYTGFLDGIRGDEGRIRNDQLAGTRNPAWSAQHGERHELLNAGHDLHRDLDGHRVAVGESDVVVSLIELPGRLLGPFDHLRVRPVPLIRPMTSS